MCCFFDFNLFKMNKCRLFLPFVIITFGLNAVAQEKQGNIVEYFGKEKVEEVREGAVIHVFRKGLLVKMRNRGFNSATFPKTPVYAKFLLGDPGPIEAGKIFTTDARGEPAAWESIETDDKSEFGDDGLRSGYLYLEYHAAKPMTVLFEASGHTMVLINGLPHEGDHYDYGWSLIPVRLNRGKNTFVLEGGRFQRMRARLIEPATVVSLTTRDMTLPDLLIEDNEPLRGAIRVVNAGAKWFEGGAIECILEGNAAQTDVPAVSPFNIRKVPFRIPSGYGMDKDKVEIEVHLKDSKGRTLHTEKVELPVKSIYDHHKRTFISNIDGSVQYYSTAPSTNKEIEKPALFFSVHGASVEAVNQANAYEKKDWGHLVAPTNRRPFGFAWEDWGRLDALEVFDHASALLHTDPQRTYLTGHSMGGHGTWYLGATYPDKWAAIGPAAGYPDLLGYRDSFRRRVENATDEELARMGITRERVESMLRVSRLNDRQDILLDSIIRRAGNPSRTLKLKRNYLHHGVYVLHGEKDSVVPTFIARDMFGILSEFHKDFAYYEYPNGSHWYGNHSVDWPPLFDFFNFRSIKAPEDIDRIEFHTASPGVSAGSHFVRILQQDIPLEISSFHFVRDSMPAITTENAETLAVDLEKMGDASPVIKVDGQNIHIDTAAERLYLKKVEEIWQVASAPSKTEKGPHRNGGFKDAFRNNMVLVYATDGTSEENDWYYHRAKFDAEKFQYRANGNVELIRDRDFDPAKYPARNVILYGNSDNNRAWNSLLSNCPVRFSSGHLQVGDKTLQGTRWGSYFIYPRHDSAVASVGVVTATGKEGMKAAYANHYLVNGTTFPDVVIFNDDVLEDGIAGVQCAGFFGNDWSVANGDFVWRE
jgi:pimeloyl-ACP methyl ester carboxylesterase